jgi:uncharacterized membrane protein YbhN (UPF0104 family)
VATVPSTKRNPSAGARTRAEATPGADATRATHIRRAWMAAAALMVVAVVAGALLGGWDVHAWLAASWDSFTSISPEYVLPALALDTLGLCFAGAAWTGILRYAYPDADVSYVRVLGCYATGVALNHVLPANGGTVVTVLMLVATIGPATPAGIVGAAAVEKLLFAVLGAFVWLYLFVSVGGTFDRKFGFVSKHGWATALVAVAVVVLAVVGGRLAWRWLKGVWEQARQGGSILFDARAYVGRVALPQLLSWCCRVAMVGVLLAAYHIPVRFHTLMSVLGGSSVANLASVTPGGIGVNQAFNVASLRDVTSSANANAYSVAHQLLTTVWSILLAAVILGVAFGPSAGRLVAQAYAQATKRDDAAADVTKRR